jgi:hypothetical protein
MKPLPRVLSLLILAPITLIGIALGLIWYAFFAGLLYAEDLFDKIIEKP